eukprot:TRINITY_DN7691_c0_g1_i1.p1 TRINITY_DN7691_c0_g1~~TRINITY_DN7691_c0_g1_i1.p1  ORF type:complete len:406 (-),score=59.50 TRINITY_DN7691_c0_g1_i1:94-1311(-)
MLLVSSPADPLLLKTSRISDKLGSSMSALVSSPAELPEGPDVLRVTTYNLLAPVWTHSSIYPGMDMTYFDPATRQQQQAKVLTELASDVVFMQECQKTELDALLCIGSIASMYDVEFCPFPQSFWTNWLTDSTNYEPRENGVCVLTKKSSVRKIRAEHVPIDLPEWQKQLPVYALGAHACVVSASIPGWNEAPVLLVTSHLDADSAYRAGLQGVALSHKINQIAAAEKCDHVVWGGDFNMEYRNPAIRSIASNGFFMASGALKTPTVYAVAATVRVDHIMLSAANPSSPGQRLESLKTFVPKCPMGHTLAVLPFLTELQWAVSTLKGDRGCIMKVLTMFALLLCFPVVLLLLSPIIIILACGRRKQCERVVWALQNWGSDHLPVTVSIRRAGEPGKAALPGSGEA